MDKGFGASLLNRWDSGFQALYSHGSVNNYIAIRRGEKLNQVAHMQNQDMLQDSYIKNPTAQVYLRRRSATDSLVGWVCSVGVDNTRMY